MIPASIQKYLNQLLQKKAVLQISSLQFQSAGGGSINDCYTIIANRSKRFFLKLNSKTIYPSLFEKEKNGLEFLAKQRVIPVPEVIFYDIVDDKQILLLEWIKAGLKTDQFWKQFGEQMAALHQITETHFGFTEDNYMGALPQVNKQNKNWVDFFIHYRLEPQITLARKRHLLENKHISSFVNLYKQLPGIFNEEKPSLLHGDLWSGNYICNENSKPVLVDPAVYFGHRSIDLAMTTLFGGYDNQFYEAYNYHFPFPGNYREQWAICNLYPLLIHLNLFGPGYLHQIESTLQKFN